MKGTFPEGNKPRLLFSVLFIQRLQHDARMLTRQVILINEIISDHPHEPFALLCTTEEGKDLLNQQQHKYQLLLVTSISCKSNELLEFRKSQ